MKENLEHSEPEEKREHRNSIEKTIFKWGQYINPENARRKLDSGELLEKASKWKITTYQSFLQCLSWLIANSKTNQDVLEITNSWKTWEHILGNNYNENWEYAIIGIHKMYSKNLEKLEQKFGEEKINGIEKWRIFPALKTVYDYIDNEENPTTENALKILEAAILPHYFKVPNDVIINFINTNINNKQNGDSLTLPPEVVKVIEKTRNKIFYNSEI